MRRVAKKVLRGLTDTLAQKFGAQSHFEHIQL